MTIQFQNSHVKKGREGWEGKAQVKDVRGYDWEIHTGKRSGGQIYAFAQSGTAKEGDIFNSFEFIMFVDPSITLVNKKGRATEKSITEAHAEALEAFKTKVQEVPERPQAEAV